MESLEEFESLVEMDEFVGHATDFNATNIPD